MTKEEVMKIWKAEVGKYDLGNGYTIEIYDRLYSKGCTLEEGVEKAHQEFKEGDTEEGEIYTLGYIQLNGEKYDMWYSWSVPFWYDKEKEEVNIMKKKQHTIGIEKRYKDVPRKSYCATTWSFSKKTKEEMIEKLKEDMK